MAELRAAALVVTPSMEHLPQHRPTLQRQKGVDSDFFSVYLPGQWRKNKSGVIILKVV